MDKKEKDELYDLLGEDAVEGEVADEKPEQKSIQVVDDTAPKSITDINLSDVKVKIDTSKSAGEQTEEVIDFVATVTAAQDKDTTEKIAQAKKEEIVKKAEVKAKEATVKSTEADTIHLMVRTIH